MDKVSQSQFRKDLRSTLSVVIALIILLICMELKLITLIRIAEFYKN
jgi:hypothetical protein